VRQFAIRPRQGGVLPARAGSARLWVDVCEISAASAITAELTATAEALRTRKRCHAGSARLSRVCSAQVEMARRALLRAISIDEGLSRATLAHDPRAA
jgi:hypothetical protein